MGGDGRRIEVVDLEGQGAMVAWHANRDRTDGYGTHFAFERHLNCLLLGN